MDKRKVTFNELVSNMFSEAERLGYTGYYIWMYLANGCGTIRKYYKSHDTLFYSVETTLKALKDAEARYESGELSYVYISRVRTAVKRMNEFFLTGTLQADSNRITTHYLLCGENEHLVEEFVHARGYTGKTQKDATWVARKYLYFFEQNGHASLQTVTIEHVRDFFYGYCG